MFIEKKINTSLFAPATHTFLERTVFKTAMNSGCAKVEGLHFLVALCKEPYGWRSFTHFLSISCLKPNTLIKLAERRFKTISQPSSIDGTKDSFTEDALKIFDDLEKLKQEHLKDREIDDFFITLAVIKNIPEDMKKRIHKSSDGKIQIDSIYTRMIEEWKIEEKLKGQKEDIFNPDARELRKELFTSKAFDVLKDAAGFASRNSYTKMEGLHIFLSLLESETKIIQEVFDCVNKDISMEKRYILREMSVMNPEQTTIELKEDYMIGNLKQQLNMAYKAAYKNKELNGGDGKISEKELLISTLDHGGEKLRRFLTGRFDEKLEAMSICAEKFVGKDEDRINQEGLEKLQSELDGLTGLKSVKKMIKEIIGEVKANIALKNKGMEITETTTYHMVFTGNPGTGKTTVARLVGQMFKNLGVLKNGHFVEVGRQDMVAEYVGQTAPKTKGVLEKGMDGVLFIDEAYSLARGGESDFGREAIDVLVDIMEKARDRLIVVLAGYSREMEDFIATNPGLKERIAFNIEFPDYETSELLEIFKNMCKKGGWGVPENVSDKLKSVFDDLRKDSKRDFGNGRKVRNIYEGMKRRLLNRIAEDSSTKHEFIIEDIVRDQGSGGGGQER